MNRIIIGCLLISACMCGCTSQEHVIQITDGSAQETAEADSSEESTGYSYKSYTTIKLTDEVTASTQYKDHILTLKTSELYVYCNGSYRFGVASATLYMDADEVGKYSSTYDGEVVWSYEIPDDSIAKIWESYGKSINQDANDYIYAGIRRLVTYAFRSYQRLQGGDYDYFAM